MTLCDCNGRRIPRRFQVTLAEATNGACTSRSSLAGVTTNAFDAAGRTVAVRNARGYLTTTVFDAAGRARDRVDALGRRTTTTSSDLQLLVREGEARHSTKTIEQTSRKETKSWLTERDSIEVLRFL